ncbi:hypothetical protein GBAR_LOCUS13897 [Geodia barretti]|uniref:Uncharacterized protein n=1 Tax=Geodia barretti TaxID=519541 RepID=A0AA35S7Z3_GEOBA|nr:hypothetical protein GBAR_LOCUS13897 [Geodia barretti]
MQPDEPGHYGKLDHSGKKTPVAYPGSSEYGKLDRSRWKILSTMANWDHPGREEPLYLTQMQASGSSARGGDMYDTVSHEPRHKVPSSKSKRQHSSSGEEASLP